jgi:nicotinamide-nucleotide amidase
MLTPFRVDTNSLYITEKLNALGCDVRLKAVVADDVDELADVVGRAAAWADVIVITGGLGPTEDDITRQAVARAFGLEFDIDDAIVDRIRQRFARRGMTMPDNNRRQGMVPRGAVVLDNANGTAPGLWIAHGRTAAVLLPGPPREMKPMLDAVLRERVEAKARGAGLFRRVLKITGRAESDVDAVASPIYSRWASARPPIATTILAVLGQIELHLTAAAAHRAEADPALDAAVRALQEALGPAVYSVDGRGLEVVVGDLLRERKWMVALAESCTGGLLASRLTDVPGSSDYVDRGVVCYSNKAKTELADVPPELIRDYGAVSEPVARAMAEGIQARAHSNVGIGVTGIAGPGGGSEAKPVGTVAIAVRSDDGERVRTFQFVGGREMVKFQASQAAMNMLRLMLLGADGGREWSERR